MDLREEIENMNEKETYIYLSNKRYEASESIKEIDALMSEINPLWSCSPNLIKTPDNKNEAKNDS